MGRIATNCKGQVLCVAEGGSENAVQGLCVAGETPYVSPAIEQTG